MVATTSLSRQRPCGEAKKRLGTFAAIVLAILLLVNVVEAKAVAIPSPATADTGPGANSALLAMKESSSDRDPGRRVATSLPVIDNWWTNLSTDGERPGPTEGHALAYDAQADQVIFFGGRRGGYYNAYTYSYALETNTWTHLYPSNPGPRAYHTMAYDSKADRVILFGGLLQAGGHEYPQNDTWAYDFYNNAWTDLKPARSPPPPNYGPPERPWVMAYDSRADRIVLVGFHDYILPSSETWTYDFANNTWTNMDPSSPPPLRDLPAMTYDSRAGRAVLFGGEAIHYNGGNWGPPTLLNDTWTYDLANNTWTNMNPPNAPPMRERHAMTYDSVADRVILFGGQTTPGGIDYNSVADNATWSYDLQGNDWTNMSPPEGPTARFGHALAFDVQSDQVVLYGGFDPARCGSIPGCESDETWAYHFPSNRTGRPTATLLGRVSLENASHAVVGAYVTVTETGERSTGAVRVLTDSNGMYRLTALAGTIRAEAARPPDLASDAVSLALLAGTVEVQNLTLKQLGTGFVTLQLFRQYIGSDMTGPITDPSLLEWFGPLVTVRGVVYEESVANPVPVFGSAGDSIQACADGWRINLPADCESAQLDEGRNATVRITLIEKGRIVGRVVDALGNPVSRWSADLYHLDAYGQRSFVRSVSGSSDAVNISVRTEGVHQLVVANPLFRGSVTVQVLAGQVVDVGAVVLRSKGLFNGGDNGMSAASGEVPPGAIVTVYSTYGNMGTEIASAARLRLEVPAETSLVANSVTLNKEPASGTLNGSSYVLSLGDVIPGNTGRAAYRLKVESTVAADELLAVAGIAYRTSAGSQEDVLGAVKIRLSRITLDVPARTTTRSVTLSGRAPPGSAVRAYDGLVLLGQANTSRGGYWTTPAVLPDLPNRTAHRLRAEADTDLGTVYTRRVSFVTVDETGPRFLELCMHVDELPRPKCFNPEDGVAYFAFLRAPNLRIDFDLRFDKPAAIHDVFVALDGPGGGHSRAVKGPDGIFRASVTMGSESPGTVRVSYSVYEFRDYPNWQLPPEEEMRQTWLPPFMGDYELKSESRNESNATVVIALPEFGNGTLTTYLAAERGVDYSPDAVDESRVAAGGFPVYGAQLSTSLEGDRVVLRTSVYIPQSAVDHFTNGTALSLHSSVPGTRGAGGFIRAVWELALARELADDLKDGFEAGAFLDDLLAGHYQEKLKELSDFTQTVQESSCPGDVKSSLLNGAESLRGELFQDLEVKGAFMIASRVLGVALAEVPPLAWLTVTAAEFLGSFIADDLIEKATDEAIDSLWDLYRDTPEILCRSEDKRGDPVADPVWLMDPSGYVYDSIPANRLAAVKATLFQRDPASVTMILWNASEFGQDNPQLTDALGRYGWDVPEGDWQVTYEKAGYLTTQSVVLHVPPPRTDVNVAMTRDPATYNNVPPIANDDTATIDEGYRAIVDVVTNDRDPDGDPVVVIAVETAAHGATLLNNNGTVSYVPLLRFVGSDSFSYTVADGNGGLDNAIVTVRVLDRTNPLPDAGPDRIARAGEVVSFDGSGSTDNVGIVRYAWDFGDGSGADGEAVNHVYNAAGNYSVRLTVEDAAGNLASDESTLTVLAELHSSPAAGLSWLLGLSVGGIAVALMLVLIRRRRKAA
jgi:hypothetical protein